jgi:Tfp pilus assembly protein PilF
MKDEDKTYENETVIDFKQAKDDRGINDLERIIDKLRNNIRDLLSMNTQYKTELADQIVKISKLESRPSVQEPLIVFICTVVLESWSL